MSDSMKIFWATVMFLICTFQIFTLMYHIRRKRNQILGVILAVVLVIGLWLCCIAAHAVRTEDGYLEPWFSVPVVLYGIVVVVLLGFSRRERRKHPGRNSVVEAFDKMNMGLCYYDANGRVILCNEYMHALSMKVFGTRVLNGRDFRFGLAAGRESGEDRNAFEVPIGGAVYYVTVRENRIQDDLVTEIKCVDVTQIHEKQEMLTENNQKLREINEHLVSYGEIADTVIREQEILNAKIRVHDTFGDLLLTSKRAIEQQVPETEMEVIVENLKSTLRYMRNDGLGDVDYYGELKKTAESIGVTIHLSGELPAEESKRDIVLVAVRECLTNTVKHGNGNNLFVEIKNGSRVRLWNDGITPEYPIHLGTGLSLLEEKVHKCGGTFKVSEQGAFSLEILI